MVRIPKTNRKRPPKGFEWTVEMCIKVIHRYTNEGPDLLAQEFGVTRATIQRMAVKLKQHTKAGYKKWAKIREENNKSYDLTYFDQWNPRMAYVLGYLFADGSVNKNFHSFGATAVRKDESVLLFIQRELKTEKGLHRTEVGQYGDEKNLPNGRTSKSTASTSLNISSSKLAKRLVELGMKPRKTYNDDPPPEVPDEVFPQFLRGLFDGDGSASTFQSGYTGNVISCCVNICGPIRFITWIRDSLVRLTGIREAKVKIRKCETTKLAIITWGSYEDIKKFHSFIYQDNFFCLERKKKVLDDWLERPHRKTRARISWTKEEEEKVKELYHRIGTVGLAKILNRSKATISYKARELGLSPLGKRGRLLVSQTIQTL